MRRLQHLLSILAALAGIGLLQYLLFSGTLTTLIAPFIPEKGYIYLSQAEGPPATLSMFEWFHYVHASALSVVLACALVLLLKPVASGILLQLASGIVSAAWCSGLYFIVFDLRIGGNEELLRLALLLSIACLGLSYRNFVKAFAVFPETYSDERRLAYYANMGKLNRVYRSNKRGLFARLRRKLLAWQVKEMRKLLGASRLGRVRGRSRVLTFGFNEMAIFRVPGLAASLACGFLVLAWAARIYVGFAPLFWVFALATLMICYLSIIVVMEKIKMDLEFGDDQTRRQVLWIYIGLFLPLVAALVIQILAYALFAIYPPLTAIAVTGLFTVFPPLWFALFVLSLMVSIYLFGAIDPERTIKSSTIFGLLSLVLTILFVYLDQLLSPLIVRYTGLPGMVGSVLAGTVVASIFTPLRSRIDSKVETVIKRVLPEPAGDRARIA